MGTKALFVLTSVKGRTKLLETLFVSAKAYGLTKLAQDTCIPRAHLYTIFSGKGNPSVESVVRIADALGFRVLLAKEEEAVT